MSTTRLGTFHKSRNAGVLAVLATAALCSLFISSCGGGGGSSPTPPASNPVPNITGLSPSSVTAGAAAQTLTITGTDFMSTSTVSYNNLAHTATYVSSTQLTISLSASDQATAGSFAVVVTNPSPGGGASNSVNFTVDNPAPQVTAISPSVLAAGSPDTPISVTGGDFMSGSEIHLSGTALTTKFVSATQLTATVAAASLANAGALQVTVVTPSPGGGTSAAQTLTVTPVSSFVLVAVPSGAPTGPWQLTVRAGDASTNPVSDLPVTFATNEGTLSIEQGTTDASGGLQASVSPPSSYAGEPVAVTATTGSQTAAVNITFSSSSSVSPSVDEELRQALAKSQRARPASSSTPTITVSPFLIGSSGGPGSANPFINPDPCFAGNSMSTVSSATCQSDLSKNGVQPNLIDVANAVCDKIGLAEGVIGCAGTAATIVGCLASETGVGAVICAGGMAFIKDLGKDCLMWLMTLVDKAVTGNSIAMDALDVLTFQPSTNPLDYVGLVCDVVDVASIGSGTGTGGVGIKITPKKPVVALGKSVQFVPALTGSTNTNVVWAVNGIIGGTAMYGTITTSGVYTAPSSLPNPVYPSVSAASVADPTAIARAHVTLVSSTGVASSGSTAVVAGLVDGQMVDKAYVPVPNSNLVSVVNLDATSGSNPVVTAIPTPNYYMPNATAANPTTQQVVAVSYSSGDVQIIDASNDQLVATLSSGVNQSVSFSGGSCMICGVAIDPTTNTAILDTAQGYLLLDLLSQQFSSFVTGSYAGENFGFNANTRIIINPVYDSYVFNGLQAIQLDDNSVWIFSGAIGSNLDSAAVDIGTNIAIVPDEFTSNEYMVNMAQAEFMSGTFSAPSSVFPITFPDCYDEFGEANDWTYAAIESSTHNLFIADEFGSCAAVQPLPPSVISGAPPLPTVFSWGHVPSAPDGAGWNNGADPHGIAVFTSVVDGKPYGLLVRIDQAYVARIDMQGVLGAPPLSGGITGEINLAPYVTFFNTQ